MRNPKHLVLFSATALIMLALAACASRYYLMVDYRLPPASDQLKGQQINLQVKDARSDQSVFTPEAARHFGAFRNHYNLTVVTEKERKPAGPRDLQGLFQDAFEKRLVNSGAQLSSTADAPLLQITINTVRMDTRDRKWIAGIVYDAELFIDNQLVIRETVTGNAERVRLIGADSVDETMSDLVTEIVNRLDIVKLLQQGKRL
jgi:hypothetical protein